MSFYTKEKRQKLNLTRAATLIPELQSICIDGLNKLESAGYEPLITEAYRSQETQNAYYAQGRLSLEEVNALRQAVELAPITLEKNESIVTRTLNSKHTSKRAFDLVNIKEGEPAWKDYSFYNWAAVIYKQSGLVYGGDWIAWRDICHFELN